jgi:hypothetical protein
MIDTPFPGNPTVFGNKNVEFLEHVGPKSYPSGGEVYDAAHLGWGGLEWVSAASGNMAVTQGATYSGTYNVRVIYATTSAIQGALPSVKLQWFVANGGAEVTAAIDLSGEVIRLFVVGV